MLIPKEKANGIRKTLVLPRQPLQTLKSKAQLVVPITMMDVHLVSHKKSPGDYCRGMRT
jgi:hypothetical protein